MFWNTFIAAVLNYTLTDYINKDVERIYQLSNDDDVQQDIVLPFALKSKCEGLFSYKSLGEVLAVFADMGNKVHVFAKYNGTSISFLYLTFYKRRVSDYEEYDEFFSFKITNIFDQVPTLLRIHMKPKFDQECGVVQKCFNDVINVIH